MPMLIPLLLATAACSSGPRQPEVAATLQVDHVWVALGKAGAVPTDAELLVKRSDKARLYVVVEAVDKKTRTRHTFSTAPKVRKGGRTVATERWPTRTAGALDLTVFRLEADPPDGGIYDNTGTLEHRWLGAARESHPEKWHWCAIDLVETDTGWGSGWEHAVDATGTTTTDYGGLGTMRFVVHVAQGKREIWSRGREHADKAGLRPGVPTIRVRRDDTAVGYMTELINVPYVYGSSSPGHAIADHQTERAVGADCADLIVYGWRRAGRKVSYTYSQGLKKYTRRMATVLGDQSEVYRNDAGQPLRFGKDVAIGDLLIWKGHVAVVAGADRSGFLTTDTPVLHTVVEAPELEPLGKMGFGFPDGNFEVWRYRGK